MKELKRVHNSSQSCDQKEFPMRQALVFMTVAVLLTGSPLWAQQPAPPPVPGVAAPQPSMPATFAPRGIVPGKSLAGIDVGSRMSLVISRFGRASEVRETSLDTVHVYSRFGIVVYAQKGVVSAVSTSNSLLKIGDALGPGSRVEEVRASLGTSAVRGAVEAFPGMIYDDRGVAFGMDGKAVALVMVFKPATAGRVSGLSGVGVGPRLPTPVAGSSNEQRQVVKSE